MADSNEILQIAITHGNWYCEHKLTFESIASSQSIRKLLYFVYNELVSKKEISSITNLPVCDKDELKKISAKYAPQLNVEEKVQYVKVIWLLAEIIWQYCYDDYFDPLTNVVRWPGKDK